MNINKILVLFTAVMGISVLGLWQFVESEQFAKFLSTRLQGTVFKYISGKLEFSELNIGLFPPATVIKNLHLVHRTKSDETIISRFHSVGIHFSALDLFSNKVSVNKLILENGFVESSENMYSQSNKKTVLPIKDIFLLLKRKILEASPVTIKSMGIQDVIILNKKNKVDIDHMDLKFYKRYVIFKGTFDQVHIEKVSKDPFYHHDSIDIDVELSKEKLHIKNIKIKDRLDTLTIEGKIEDGQTGYHWNGKLNYRGGMKKIGMSSFVLRKALGSQSTGYLDIEIKTHKKKKDSHIHALVQGHNIKTPWFLADMVKFNVNSDFQEITIDSLQIKRNGGMLKTVRPVKIFNVKTKKIVSIKTQLATHNLFVNDALYFFKSLNVLKGRCQGNIDVAWSGQDISFDFEKGFMLSQFELKTPTGDRNILQNDKIVLNSGRIQVLSKEKIWISGDVKALQTKLKGDGFIDLKNRMVDININSTFVDLLSFGPVAGLKLSGQGPLMMHIVGPLKKTQFKIDANLDHFKVKGFELGRLSGKAIFFLEDRLLALKDIKSKRAFSLLKGKGFFEFKKKSKWRLDIDIQKSHLKEFFFLARPVLQSFESKLRPVSCRLKGDVRIKGELQKDKFLVSGNIYAQDISIYKKEEISTLKASYQYKGGLLNITNLSAKKATGYLNGKANINIKNNFFEYEAKLSNISLKDIHFYRLLGLKYDGIIYGESKGSGYLNNHITKTSMSVKKGIIGSKKIGDSVFNISSRSKEIAFSGKLFENIGNLEGRISLKNKKKLSYLKWDINAPNTYLLAGLFSEKNILDTTLRGNIHATADMRFHLFPLDIVYGKVEIKELSFKRGRVVLDMVPEKNEIIINNNKISRWDIAIRGSDNFIKSYGKGNLSKEFKIKQTFKLDTSLGALVVPKVQNMYGHLMGDHTLMGKNRDIFHKLKIKSNDIFLKVRGIPNAFSGIALDLAMSGKKIVFNRLEAIFGDGRIKGKGKMVLGFPFPMLDISLNVDSSKISFFKKSNVVSSANMHLVGERLPYHLKGDISILHGSVQDEVKDIVENIPAFKSYSKYIPKGRENNALDYLVYDLNANIFNPIVLSNSLADIKVIGACKVQGSMKNPLLAGELNIIKRTSKIMFKGNDFALTEGLLSFHDTKEKKSPKIKLVGISNINDYSVKLDISGDLKASKIELSSIPALSREDILSLLTFGITSSTSKNLDEKDRQSITTLGFGSLLVDQLKLQEGLSSSLGLRLSLLPELEDRESSLLLGRSQEGEALSKKVKTATKIQIQKKLSEKVDMSLSSTLGESQEQKQTMNIIYNVNENFSLEGVYEVKSSDTEEEALPNSGGVDLKYRFSF